MKIGGKTVTVPRTFEILSTVAVVAVSLTLVFEAVARGRGVFDIVGYGLLGQWLILWPARLAVLQQRREVDELIGLLSPGVRRRLRLISPGLAIAVMAVVAGFDFGLNLPIAGWVAVCLWGAGLVLGFMAYDPST